MSRTRTTTTTTRTRTRTKSALAIAAAMLLSGALAAPRTAEACGMRAFYRAPVRKIVPRDPGALLAQARRHLERKENVSALLAAQQVIDRAGSDAEARAEAWAIVGWVRWQGGRKADAVKAVQQGQALDADTVELALARVEDTKVSRAFRKAVGA